MDPWLAWAIGWITGGLWVGLIVIWALEHGAKGAAK